MNARVAEALVNHIRDLPGKSKFLIVEGSSVQLAQALTKVWTEDLPPLLIGGEPASSFGKYALDSRSGTQLRNSNARGVCLIACEGFEIPDWQSVSKFPSITPSDLLTTSEGLVLLATAGAKVDLDGPIRHIRQAILTASAYERPTAFEVASFFDAVAAGESPQLALPRLGAYRDPANPPSFGPERVLENLRLARKTFSESIGSFNDVRRRAERILNRNPSRERSADDFMRLLQKGDRRIFAFIDFDEARSIIEDVAPADLTEAVRTDLADRQRFLHRSGGSAAVDEVPWENYNGAAEDLRDSQIRKEAARNLLEFNVSQDYHAFQASTRKKLEAIFRDRTLTSSDDSIEELLLRGVASLQSPLTRIWIPPAAAVPAGPTSRTAALRLLVAAVASMRLRRFLNDLSASHKVNVDGALLKSPRDIFAGQEADVFAETFRRAEISEETGLPTLAIRVAGQNEDTLELKWRPSVDDIAILKAAWLFDSEQSLTLQMEGFPSAAAFCSCSDAVAPEVAQNLKKLRNALGQTAKDALDHGLSSVLMRTWTEKWRKTVMEIGPVGELKICEELALVGAIRGSHTAIGLTVFAPLKTEWLAGQMEAMHQLLMTVIGIRASGQTDNDSVESIAAAMVSARSIARLTASHYPPFLRVAINDDPILPVSETPLWSVYATDFRQTEDPYAESAIGDVIEKLLTLQPEVGTHLKCLAFGPNAPSVLVREALRLLDRNVGRTKLQRCEVICVGDRPDPETLLEADEVLTNDRRHLLQLRYFSTFDDAKQALHATSDTPFAHLGLVTGLSGTGDRLSINSIEIPLPDQDEDVLLVPKTWLRASAQRRFLLVSPTVSKAGAAWLQLMTGIEDSWPTNENKIRVPELGTSSANVKEYLRAAHDHAVWVATVDRYASRETLERALGSEVAILHQQRRLSAESPIGLVISQKSGGSADRAIARSLKAARLIEDANLSSQIGRKLREVASQGYGILALEAATTGAGINELVAHVCAFSLLGSKATPWPLPPNCRVLLLSLDEYAGWFPTGKRADLLALAIDTANGGLHVATIEVKARRADNEAANRAAVEALDQLRHTLTATRYAAHNNTSLIHARIWLNRVAEAAYSVAREIGFRLDQAELNAIEAFRRGKGSLEWAGMGLIFGPDLDPIERHHSQEIFGDLVPIAVHNVKLTPELLTTSVSTKLTELRTVQSEKGPLPGGRQRRRPEKGVVRSNSSGNGGGPRNDDEQTRETGAAPKPALISQEPAAAEANSTGTDLTPKEFQAPLLGWMAGTNNPAPWNVAGANVTLQNGHMEVWGSSGAGKTQFIMGLLLQLSKKNSCRFGIADFKNDYGGAFLEKTGTAFFDLWNDGAPYNPLALLNNNPRAVETSIIELRDIVEVAARSFTNMGHRQQAKLQDALRQAYEIGRREHRWPTLKTLDDLLDRDLRGIIGDLTSHNLFKDGPPLGEIVERNVVFGLSKIPGNGLTTILAGGFILSALLLKIQSLEPVANTVRYIAVVDEAHRVAGFKAIDTMIREGRSKGLAVILATQQPNDLPEVIGANALTKICFRLPDAVMAKAAAKRLNPNDRRLADQIKTLSVGEAFISLAGQAPQLVRMVQLWRDADQLIS